jgi:hypothetical protein
LRRGWMKGKYEDATVIFLEERVIQWFKFGTARD